MSDDREVGLCLLCRPVQQLGHTAAIDNDFGVRARVVRKLGDLFGGEAGDPRFPHRVDVGSAISAASAGCGGCERLSTRGNGFRAAPWPSLSPTESGRTHRGHASTSRSGRRSGQRAVFTISWEGSPRRPDPTERAGRCARASPARGSRAAFQHAGGIAERRDHVQQDRFGMKAARQPRRLLYDVPGSIRKKQLLNVAAYDYFFPGITTFETVMVSPFISPVSRTVSPACACNKARS